MFSPYSALSVVLIVVAGGCAHEPEQAGGTESYDWPEEVSTRADSVAQRVLDYAGGAQAWRSLPYVRFDFAYHPGNQPRPPRKHLWDRMTGRYRLEQPAGQDSTHVVLFNTTSREGAAYLNGDPLSEEESARRVSSAYAAFINDTYWLLMPAKLLDPGVNRHYVADSSSDNTDVINLTFGEVGLTPGDTYWIWADRITGKVEKWAYVLERNPDAAPTYWRWEDWTTFEVEGGHVRMAASKVGATATIKTESIEVPAEVDASLFEDPFPRLN